MRTELSEAGPAESEVRQQGLRVLARMIAWMYVRDIRATSQVALEPDEGISPQAQGHLRMAPAEEAPGEECRTASPS